MRKQLQDEKLKLTHTKEDRVKLRALKKRYENAMATSVASASVAPVKRGQIASAVVGGVSTRLTKKNKNNNKCSRNTPGLI